MHLHNATIQEILTWCSLSGNTDFGKFPFWYLSVGNGAIVNLYNRERYNINYASIAIQIENRRQNVFIE